MSDEQINFKVTDRRLFNPDGTPRDLPPDEKPQPVQPVQPKVGSTAEAESPASAETRPSAEPQAASRTASSLSPEAATSAAPTPESEDESDLPDAEDPTSFVNFIMSIASNAASSLGMMEHPVTHQREVDLELGKHWIDVLGMLQEKTRGNLSPQEQQIIEGLLADLRMQYVSLANSTPAKASRAFTGRDIIGG